MRFTLWLERGRSSGIGRVGDIAAMRGGIPPKSASTFRAFVASGRSLRRGNTALWLFDEVAAEFA